MAFRIRKMKDSDGLAVCELAKQLGYDLDPAQFLGRLFLINQNENHTLWVMESPEGGIAACAHFHKTLGLVHPPRLEIKTLVVSDQVRRKGLGKRFMLYAESFARSEELSQVYLTSNIARTETHAFYETIGYQKMKTSHIFLKNLII